MKKAALFYRLINSYVHFIDKRNAGNPADPAYLAKLAAEADFLITAVGD